jgi:uncharacterized lipoprotein YehR (DUF1307 family)
MKKTFLLLVLVCTVVLAGCSMGKKTTTTGSGDTTTTTSSANTKYSFEDANCQSYVDLMECLIDKTPEASKEQTQKSFDQVMSMWKSLDATTLPSTCKQTMDMLANQKEVFANAGCPLN